MMKRILSGLLALLMVASILPASAFAEDAAESCTTCGNVECICEAGKEPCTTCGQENCESQHLTWCEVCQKDDCGDPHLTVADVDVCETCGNEVCTCPPVQTCEICGNEVCTCEKDQTEPCTTCGKEDCTSEHKNWCATCGKDDCGVDHTRIPMTSPGPKTVKEATHPMVGKIVVLKTQYPQAIPDISNPSIFDYTVQKAYPERMEIEAVVTDGSTVYYQLKAVEGESWPDYVQDMNAGTTINYEHYWIKSGSVEEIEPEEPETTCPNCGQTDCDGQTCLAVEKAYEDLLSAGCLEEFESILNALEQKVRQALEASEYWEEIQVEYYHHVYSHFYSLGTEAEFDAHAAKYPEAFAYIQNDATLKLYNDKHLARIRYVAENPNIYLDLSDEKIPVVYPSYTDAAGLVKNPPVQAAQETVPFNLLRLMKPRNTSSSAAVDTDGDGIALGKDVYKNDDGTYTVRLEAYTTGSKVTSVHTTEMPADIILVLDLSNSMITSFKGSNYQAITNGTAGAVATQYSGEEQVFVLVGDQYKPVTITGVGTASSRDVYSVYKKIVTSSSQYNSDCNYEASTLYNYIVNNANNNKALYYQTEDGSYHKMWATRSGYWNYRYTFSYYNAGDSGATTTIVSNVTGDTILNSVTYTFYTKSEAMGYDSYTFSYEGENGQVIKTYTFDEFIGFGTAPGYYVRYTSADGTQLRAKALRDAVSNFASQVAIKAKGTDGVMGTEDDVAHNISIVGFNGDNTSSTGIYIGDIVHRWNASNINNIYGIALQNMATEVGTMNVYKSIDALSNASGTRADIGTSMALNILNAYKNEADRYIVNGKTVRSKVVVVFTDGAPTNNNYNDPIANTYQIKNTHGATVYTVGILEGGNTDLPPSNRDNLNKYMHYMSSNYPEAQNMNHDPDDYEEPENGGYYLLASNADDLNGIFSTISSSATEGGAKVELSTQTQVRDLISPYFKLPAGADTSSITFKTASYGQGGTWSADTTLNGCTATIGGGDNKTIGVTGFDFAANWVGTETAADGTVTYRGKKLIIEFPIVVEPDFLGGTGVPTNGDTSGIYENANAADALETFNVPNKDVPLKNIKTVVKNREIYLGNTVNLIDVLDLHVAESNSGKDLKDIANGVNNAYVNLVYDVEVDGKKIATYTIPAGSLWNAGTWSDIAENIENINALLLTKDTAYSITCTMIDKSEYDAYIENGVLPGPDSEGRTWWRQATGTATVYVAKPTITFKDATKYYNEDKVNFEAENFVNITWSDPSAIATEGTAPEITLSYTQVDGCIAADGTVITPNDFYVNVLVESNRPLVAENVVFAHTPCDPACAFDPANGEFMIHVKHRRGSLQVSKHVTKAFTDDVEPTFAQLTTDFTFTVTVTEPMPGTVYTFEKYTQPKDVTLLQLQSTKFVLEKTEGTLTADAQGNIIFTLKHGEYIVIHDLPAGACVIAETEVDGYDPYVFDKKSYQIPEGGMEEANCTNAIARTTGSLVITKTVVNPNNVEGVVHEDGFQFTVTLDEYNGTTIPVTFNRAGEEKPSVENITLTSGVENQKSFTFKLKDGESASILNIPATGYTVAEAVYDYFETTWNNGTDQGVLRGGETVNAVCTNTYGKNTGDLRITKEVTSQSESYPAPDDTFVIQVELYQQGQNQNKENLTVKVPYYICGKDENPAEDAEPSGTITGTGSIQLKKDQSAVIKGIPTCNYTITETNAINVAAGLNYDLDTHYIVDYEANAGQIKNGQTAQAKVINTYRRHLGEMTIRKRGAETIDENQTFIFNVKCIESTFGRPVDMKVVVKGNGEVKLGKLPIGIYTITEESDWSWRYELESVKVENGNGAVSGSTITVEVDGEHHPVITVTNKRTIKQWLNGASAKPNNFKGTIN